MKRKQKILIAISLLVIVCLLGTGTFIYLEYFAVQREISVEQPIAHIIDDRISPYENQALVLEVLRIRHRGLLDELITRGNAWKTKPMFYFISNIDGAEYISKDVSQWGQSEEVLFNTWDTIFQENKILRDVEQEQEKSQVTLTIVEREKIGLLGLRSRDVEKDSFSVTYCFRTGRWTGDDYFGDPDGYGYYLGETFEIWFNLYQPDIDGDQIPYWTEVNILGTDPTIDDRYTDHDGDGVSTYWEWRWGYDPHTWDDHENLDPDLDGITNIGEYHLAKWFANPYIEDLYCEVDYMGQGGINDPPHIFFEETKQGLIERFAQHNIKAFYDDGWPNSPPNGGGQIVPHINRLSQDSGMILQYYRNYFPDERKGIFRYIVIGHGGGFVHPAEGNVYDVIQVSYTSSKFAPIQRIIEFFTYARIPTQRGIRVALGAVILHELAHSCGIGASTFAGIDNINYRSPIFPSKEYKDTWGQYHSVLNYLHMYKPSLFDLSHGQNGPPYDQDDWGNLLVGSFNKHARLIEEANYEISDKHKDLVLETPPVTGYIYDHDLTQEFKKQTGGFSPNTRWSVNWSVYRIADREQFPQHRDVKVFVQPVGIANEYNMSWFLYKEGDLDAQGNMHFYSFDALVKEILN